MAAVSKIKRTYTASFITGAGIILMTLYYIFFYMPAKEERINARYYRVLQRISENLNNNIEHYQFFIAPNFAKQYNSDSLYWKSKTHTSGMWMDTVCKKNQLHFNYPDNTLHIPALVSRKNSSKNTSLHTSIPSENILMPLMRGDIFNNFMVLQRDSGSIDPNLHNLIFVTDDGKKSKSVNLVPQDTLNNLAINSAWQKPVSLNIAGVPHMIFVVTQRVGPREEWILIGAVNGERYDTERKAVPTHALTFVSITFAILFLGFPFLKIVLMSRQERLHKRDVVISVVSVFTGVALVVILILDGYAYYGPDREKELRRLEKLNRKLSDNLVKEIKGLVSQLNSLDKLDKTHHYTYLQQVRLSPIKSDSIAPYYELRGVPVHSTDSVIANTDSIVENPDIPYELPHLDRVFWSDSAGSILQYLTTGATIDSVESIKNRDYLKAIKKGYTWNIQEQSEKFYLQSISSLINGSKYAVVSTKSNRKEMFFPSKPYMIALTTKLSSLHNPIIPPGYGFCIINDKGEVLFHQLENLNLNENLLEETEDDPVLAAALQARVPAHFVQDYQGGRQSLFVSPINQLPMFMVTYIDNEIRRETNVYIILQTIVSFLLYSFILLLMISLLIYGKKRLSKLSFSWLAFRWLWPDPDKSTQYLKCLAAFVITIFAFMAIADVGYPVGLFFICLYAATYIFVFCYITLHSVPIWLFLKRKGKSYYATRLKHFFFSSVAVVLFLNSICLIASARAFKSGLLFQLVILIGYILVQFAYNSFSQKWTSLTISKTQKQNWLKKQYRKTYVSMLISWLILSSALPAYYMFKVSYNLESARSVMLSQLYLSSRQEENVSGTRAIVPDNYAIGDKKNNYTDFFQNTKFYKVLTGSPNINEKRKSVPPGPNDISTVALGYNLNNNQGYQLESGTQIINSILSLSFWFLGPSKSNLLLTQGCQSQPCIERLWSSLDSSNLKFISPRLNKFDSDSLVILSSNLPKFKLPPLLYADEPWPDSINKSGILFWADLIILVFLLFYFLSFLVNRIFNLELLQNIRMRQIDKKLLNPTCINKLFTVSLPGAPFIKEIVKRQEKSCGCITQFVTYDLSQNSAFSDVRNAVLRKSNRNRLLIYIKNFDHRPLAEDSLQQKVLLLQQLHTLKGEKIIIESSLHPSYWEEKLKNTSSTVGKTKELMRQLISLLSTFTKIYNPLQTSEFSPNTKLQYMNKKELLIQFVKQECKSLPHLNQYRTELYSYINHNHSTKGIEKEDLIYRIQSLAQLYYRRLWSTCSEEEKFFLYDLAQDGLVNARNMGVLSSLLGKGLLIRGKDMKLKILNESFKNFVLTVVDPAEALRYEKKVSRASSWHAYRTPFLLIIIGIGLFIFFTQKQAWLNIVAIGTAVTTILTLMPRLSVFLPAFLLNKDSK